MSLQAFHRAQLETSLVPLKRESCFFLYIGQIGEAKS